MSATQSDRWSLCIEIFLKTVEGDIMTLETWNISLIADACDNTKSYTLYSRLGILLKSLLAVTRVVPAYRYSRRQNPDSWIIGHRMYAGDPLCNSLGDRYKQIKVGTVCTPIGALQLSVSYRTNMTISPQPSGIDTSIMVKSDHFRPDFSPKHNRNQQSDDNSTSLSEGSSYKTGAFVESRRESLIPTDTDSLIPAMPFVNLLTVKVPQQQSPTNAVNGNELCDRLKAIEFDKDASDANGNVPVTKSVSSCNDDFIHVELVKPPFAEPSGNIELGTFYQEWKMAPPLQTCPNDPKVIDQVGDLTSQLAIYETSLKEFDSVVTSLCHEGTDNNENTSPYEL